MNLFPQVFCSRKWKGVLGFCNLWLLFTTMFVPGFKVFVLSMPLIWDAFFLILYGWFILVIQILASLTPRGLSGLSNQNCPFYSFFLSYFNDLHCTGIFLIRYLVFCFSLLPPFLLPHFQWKCKFHERGTLSSLLP